MAITTAEPTSARICRKRANPSTMMLPPKATSLPGGSAATTTATTSSRVIDSSLIRLAARGPRKTPSISRAMAPSASSSSGSTGSSAGAWGFIGSTFWQDPASCRGRSTTGETRSTPQRAPRGEKNGGTGGDPQHRALWPPFSREDGAGRTRSRQHRRRPCGTDRVAVAVDQRCDRGGREIEDPVGKHAEQDGEDHEGGERDDLARPQVAQGRQRRLERAEDHLAIEPQGVAGRQDEAGRRQEGHRGIDLEGADQGEELTDEAGGAGQPDIGQGNTMKAAA